MSATKTKVKVSLKVSKQLKGVLKRLSKLGNWRDILKTAVTTGYLSDGDQLMTVVTAEEQSELKKFRIPKTTKAFNAKKKLPTVVGLTANISSEQQGDDSVTLVSGGLTVQADPILSKLLELHPTATVHLPLEKPTDGPVLLSTRTRLVATCPLLKAEEKPEPTTQPTTPAKKKKTAKKK